MICDHESHLPVALLSNRTPESITKWLKQHPHVALISRDGYTGFRQGIAEASHDILQVYDRWHFIRNARKQLDSALSTLVPPVLTWNHPAEAGNPEVLLTKVQERAKKKMDQRCSLIQQVQSEFVSGKNVPFLAKEFGLDPRTVKRYITMKEPPVGRRPRKKGADPYKARIEELEKDGHTINEIVSFLQLEGYKGTRSQVRIIVEMIRKKRKHGLLNDMSTKLSRRKLASLLWKGIKKLDKQEWLLVQKCLELYPSVEPICRVVQSYRDCLDKKDYDGFLMWLKEQLSERKQPFYHYALRLRSDIKAVKNAFCLPYSNGLLEGHVNRLKTIKRMLYGRAGLPILEKRVLYRL
ncbi:transposase [Domibacillus sp. A3M-37]|uniref:transposase n=1 Tax=Domibacillus sp. A3M-37 TaxID=2962037 RepID=UPI0020B760BD|nr:transposase [Domibacillus sp. A3M-37]